MKKMIQQTKEKQGGFTLVELIVVLVILALLAAILVPTLTGYINKAKDEKNFQAAQSVYVAAQAVADDQYAHSNLNDYAITNSDKTANGDDNVAKLSGVGAAFKKCQFNTDHEGKIKDGWVQLDNTYYVFDGTNWSASDHQPRHSAFNG